MNWRHRPALIEQWNRVNLALTAKVLTFMYGPSFPELKIGMPKFLSLKLFVRVFYFCAGEEDLIPQGMSNDCIAQSWYRFLNTIGNPVSLTKPEVREFFSYSTIKYIYWVYKYKRHIVETSGKNLQTKVT